MKRGCEAGRFESPTVNDLRTGEMGIAFVYETHEVEYGESTVDSDGLVGRNACPRTV